MILIVLMIRIFWNFKKSIFLSCLTGLKIAGLWPRLGEADNTDLWLVNTEAFLASDWWNLCSLSPSSYINNSVPWNLETLWSII